MRYFLALVVILVALGVVGGLCTAYASDVSAIVIDSPPSGSSIHGSDVYITTTFKSVENKPITKVRVLLDDKFITERKYDTPMTGGTCSFQWDTVRTPNGTHKLAAKIYSEDSYLGMAVCWVKVSNGDSLPANIQITNEPKGITLPRAAVIQPRNGDIVSGTTDIIVNATADGGEEPFVSIYIDKSLRSMKNQGPYVYKWDTTQDADGPKIIEVAAVDKANNFVQAKAVEVVVQNHAGRMTASDVTPSSKTISIPMTTTSATPRPTATRTTESARTATKDPVTESFEVDQTHVVRASTAKPPAAKVLTVPAPVTQPKPVAVPKPSTPKLETSTMMAQLVKTDDFKTLIPKVVNSAAPVKKTATVEKPRKIAASKTAALREYAVQEGDSILSIAKEFEVDGKSLAVLNELEKPYLLHIGDKLKIPADPVLVPLRPAFQATGGSVTWDAGSREVHAVDSTHNVILKPGSKQAVVNSEKVRMDAPTTIREGRTFVSQSFITGSLEMGK